MVEITVDVIPKLKIFSEEKVAVITINNIQISKFTFEECMENSRNEKWEMKKKDSRPCMDFYVGKKLINVVRNCEIEFFED